MVKIVQKKLRCFDKLRLGQGSGGTVDRVTRRDGKHYVLKTVADGQDGLREMSNLIMLEGAPHGIQLLMASVVTSPKLDVSLLFAYHGVFTMDLVSYVNTRGTLDPSLVRLIARQLIKFISWCIDKAALYHSDLR